MKKLILLFAIVLFLFLATTSYAGTIFREYSADNGMIFTVKTTPTRGVYLWNMAGVRYKAVVLKNRITLKDTLYGTTASVYKDANDEIVYDTGYTQVYWDEASLGYAMFEATMRDYKKRR